MVNFSSIWALNTICLLTMDDIMDSILDFDLASAVAVIMAFAMAVIMAFAVVSFMDFIVKVQVVATKEARRANLLARLEVTIVFVVVVME